jgi:hypothetical protein
MCCAGADITRLKTYAAEPQAKLNLNHLPASAAALPRICEPVSCILTLQLNSASPDIIAKWDGKYAGLGLSS